MSVENLVIEGVEEVKNSTSLKKNDPLKSESLLKGEDKNQDIDKQTLNLIYKAVKDNSDESGWAYLGAVGTYLSHVKPDFDTRNYNHEKLSGLIKALGVFEIKMQGSQMYLRKASFSAFIKFVQKAIHDNLNKDGWANLTDVINYLKKSDLNIRNYEEAIESIHNGWVETQSNNDGIQSIRIVKSMP